MEHVKKLIRDGVIEPSLSNYSSPILLLPKPGRGLTVLYLFRGHRFFMCT